MPSYSFQCPSCGAKRTVVRMIARRNDPVRCAPCRSRMTRIVEDAAVQVFKPYVHNNLDANPVHIRSRRQERDEFNKRGLIDAR